MRYGGLPWMSPHWALMAGPPKAVHRLARLPPVGKVGAATGILPVRHSGSTFNAGKITRGFNADSWLASYFPLPMYSGGGLGWGFFFVTSQECASDPYALRLSDRPAL